MQKQVISASRRTDIPAFYLKWFMAAIKEGKVNVQNPFYKKNYYTVNLSSQYVGWIVFWSRNYSVFLKNHDFFQDYQLFFHFTVLSHHHIFEKNHLSLKEALIQAEKLVKIYGPERIIWRYDPIIIWYNYKKNETNFNKNDFIFLNKNFSQLGIKRCYFSFVSYYKKFERRLRKKLPHIKLDTNNIDLQNNILSTIQKISTDNNIRLYSCCNDQLVKNGIEKGSCISGNLLNKLSNKITVTTAKAPTRKDCGCTRSIDIGNYSQQPCYYGCIYCYANPLL